MKIQVFKSGKLLKEFEITKNNFILGRADDCDVCILDENVARKHLEFKVSENGEVSFYKKAKFGLLYKNGDDVTEGVLLPGEDVEIGDIKIALSSEGVDKTKDKDKPATSDFDFFTMSVEPEPLPSEEKKEEDEKLEKKKKEKAKAKEKEREKEKEQEQKVEAEEKVKEESKKIEPEVKEPLVTDATTVGHAYLLCQLIAISGPHKDKIFSVEKDVAVIGRAKKADIVLVDDMVSREHARLYKQGSDHYILDLNSSNGVRVNGKKVSEPTMLASGDIVEIGSSTLRFMVINPQVQSVQSNISVVSSKSSKPPVVEKVSSKKSEKEIKKIERSYGVDTEKDVSKKKMLFPVLILLILGIVAVLVMPSGGKQPTSKAENTDKKAEEKKEESPEIKCSEKGSFCDQPLAVQNQLMAEYDVAVKLFKNFQFELAEDRAQQILAKVSDWDKAKELLDLASAEKEKLLAQKKEEEEAQVRKMLEKKVSKFLKDAESSMRAEQYDKVKELISKIFELDPNNERAKKIADEVDEILAKRQRLAEQRSKFLATVAKYENILKDAKKLYSDKEYAKAIENFQKCSAFPPMESERAKEIREECKKLLTGSQRLLQEAITPELSVAAEAYNNEQYRDSIASYQRVLKLDYKNKAAKQGMEKAKSALNEEAKERFSRAAIAESVSDFTTACSLYYSVVEIALPGTKYYDNAMERVKKRCNAKF